jgi:SAM-dependent MidA family methyltransferase
MRAMQKNALLPASLHNGTDWEIVWHDAIDDVLRSTGEGEYTMLVAHEFFDALPVHVLQVRTPFLCILFLSLNLSLRKHTKAGKKFSDPSDPTMVHPLLWLSTNPYNHLPLHLWHLNLAYTPFFPLP